MSLTAGTSATALNLATKGGGSINSEDKKRVIDEYLRIGTYSGTAKSLGMSSSTVRRIVLKAKGGESRAEDAKPRTEAPAQRSDIAMEIIDRCLRLLGDERKLEAATLPQLSSAICTLMDRFASEPEERSEFREDSLSLSLREAAKYLFEDLGGCQRSEEEENAD